MTYRIENKIIQYKKNIFHASVILPFIFITISWRIVIPGLLYLCDKMIYIQIHLGQCDLYYMA